MSRKWRRTAAVIMAALLSAACGQKPSTIRESAASRAREFPQEAPAEPADETSGADVATSPDAGVPAPAPVSPDALAASEPLPSGDGSAPVMGPPAPAPASSGPASRSARSRRAAASSDSAASQAAAGSSAAPAPGRSSPPGGEHGTSGPAPQPSPPREALEGVLDRTGVDDTTIRIGIHAPVTGAAPFPQRTFEQGKDVY